MKGKELREWLKRRAEEFMAEFDRSGLDAAWRNRAEFIKSIPSGSTLNSSTS